MDGYMMYVECKLRKYNAWYSAVRLWQFLSISEAILLSWLAGYVKLVNSIPPLLVKQQAQKFLIYPNQS